MWAQKKQLGFTIVELLIVIVVIAILAAITIVAYTGIQDRANASAMVSEVTQVVKKLEAYKVQNADLYPTTLSAASITETAGYTYSYTPSPSRGAYSFNLQDGSTNYFATSGNKTPMLGNGDGLVAWWPFNDSPLDVAGGLESTIYSSVTATTGQNGQANSAYAFNGNDTRIDAPGEDPIVLNRNIGDLTISFWYLGEHTTNGTRFILSRRSADSSSSTDYLFFITAGYFIFGTGSGDECAWPDASTTLYQVSEPSRNTWHHVVGTINQTAAQEGTKTVWVDGQKQSDCAYTHKSSAGGADLHIGTRYTTSAGANYFLGSLDDLRMYNRTLSDQEIEALYTAGAQ